MPTSYRIEPDKRMVLIHAWDHVTMADINEYHRAIRSDPAFDADYDQLWDVSNISILDAPSQVIRQEATAPPFSKTSRVAIFAESDFVYGMARMFAIYAELSGRSVRIFRTLQGARDWLSHGTD